MIDGKQGEKIAGATSYIYRVMTNGVRKIESLGKGLQTAFVRYQSLSADADRVQADKLPIQAEPVQKTNPQRLTIAEAVQGYLADNADKLANGDLWKTSVIAYDAAVIDFRHNAKIISMAEITRKVLIGP